MNILIAEDESVSRRRLEHFLEKWGHSVLLAKNGLEALELFLSNDVDMVITDWMMPEMDGLELTRHVANHTTDAPYVYVILLTARGETADVVQGLTDSGVDDYVVKPFDPDELQARLSVGVRTVRLERKLREYSQGLEKIVKRQTHVIRKTQEETIIRLLTALESRDEETAGHVQRIAEFGATMANATGWSTDRISDMRLAAPMHDIGKIGIPDSILRKSARLTAEEFEIIKEHTTIGGQILGGSQYPMLQMAHEIALSHHEWWDGNGYPHGIAGDNIPESARIVAIADVFDALSHDRIYHKALPREEVIAYMRNGRGKQFDPILLDLFLDLLPDVQQIIDDIG